MSEGTRLQQKQQCLRDQAVALHAQGLKGAEIGRRLGQTRQWVSLVLAPIKHTDERLAARRAEVARLDADGLTIAAIAARLGVPFHTVQADRVGLGLVAQRGPKLDADTPANVRDLMSMGRSSSALARSLTQPRCLL